MLCLVYSCGTFDYGCRLLAGLLIGLSRPDLREWFVEKGCFERDVCNDMRNHLKIQSILNI